MDPPPSVTPGEDRAPASAHGGEGAHGSYRAGFAYGMLSFTVMACLAVVSAIATGRIYGVRIVGQFALVSAPVAAVWLLSTAKEQAALIKEVTRLPARHPRVSELFAAVFTFSSGLTVGVAAIGAVVCALLFRGPLHHPELVAPMVANVAGYAIVTNTAFNLDAVFSAFLAGRRLFWVRLHETLSFLASAVAIGLRWHSVWGLVIATIVGSLTALVHRLLAVRRFARLRLGAAGYRRGMAALPGLLRFGLKITPGGVAQGVSQQAGIWALASVAPAATVGAYSRAQTIPERMQQMNFRIAEVLYPTLVGRHARGDQEGFARALLDTVRYGLIGMLLLASVGGGAAHAVLSLFGPGFSRASPAFAILILYPAFCVLESAQNQALFAIDRPGLTSVIALARMGVTVALTVILTPRVGIAGPAIAVIGGLLLDAVWKTAALLPFLSRSVRDIWGRGERLALLGAYAGGFLTAHALERSGSSVVWLALSLAAGALAYCAILLLGRGINARDRARLLEALVLARRWRAERRPLGAAT